MSETQALAESSRDNCAPGTALIDTEEQEVCHNPRAIIPLVHTIFGTVDKGRQIISTLFGPRADLVLGLEFGSANKYRTYLGLANANFASNFNEMPSTGMQNTIKVFNTEKP
ncbi:unnamed protein product [Clonostachys rosea f. rosea IK726]|uniref:Uncharacterized protein n=2 Tax=Clonostachys rosea f. rosea IK726 TaxID=1349383 RepID=A0ACA9UC71_BIOOC|nr:unnamed protein product [Clonostachys rosea f. rosea IK726]CAG9955473.1 unnamed protein product [Clonostachys rosea f. rosea IK726]